jgi:hypothetical protein
MSWREAAEEKSSLSHPGFFTLCSHLPLIQQGRPRRNLDEDGSGTAGASFQKTFPIRLSKFPREAFLTEIPTICQENKEDDNGGREASPVDESLQKTAEETKIPIWV